MAAEGTSAIREAARAIASRGNCVALTGAGISVESGVPAFRGAQGLWDRFDPMEYATIGAFRKDPGKVWRMLAEMIEILGRAAPNPAHRGIAELESLGLLRSVITQNVDGLHQTAGSRGVVEFHGSARELVCLFCPNRYPTREKVLEGIPPPLRVRGDPQARHHLLRGADPPRRDGDGRERGGSGRGRAPAGLAGCWSGWRCCRCPAA